MVIYTHSHTYIYIRWNDMTVQGEGLIGGSYKETRITRFYFFFFLSYRCRLVKYYFIKTGIMRNDSTFLSFINCIGHRALFRGGVIAWSRLGKRKQSIYYTTWIICVVSKADKLIDLLIIFKIRPYMEFHYKILWNNAIKTTAKEVVFLYLVW